MVVVRQIVLGVRDVDRATAFWCGLLDYRPVGDPCGSFRVLAPSDPDGVRIALQRSTADVEPFPRVHVDLAVHGRRELSDLADCAVSLGGARVDWPLYPPDPDFVVLADTEGNRFCVIDLDHPSP